MTELKSWVIDTRPLRVTTFRRTWIGNSASYFGFQFTAVAVPVQMFAITDSPTWVGLLGVAGLVPLLIFGLWGGAVADAVDRRRLLLASSTLTWLTTCALLAQAVLGVRSAHLLLLLTAVQSAGFAISSPARQAIVPRIVPEPKIARSEIWVLSSMSNPKLPSCGWLMTPGARCGGMRL